MKPRIRIKRIHHTSAYPLGFGYSLQGCGDKNPFNWTKPEDAFQYHEVGFKSLVGEDAVLFQVSSNIQDVVFRTLSPQP